jgi:glycopeptide antibiotics resistance protein
MNRRQLTTGAVIYGVYICIATLYPFEPSQDPSHSLARAFTRPFEHFGTTDFIVNVLLFVPLGALFRCLCTLRRRRTFVVLIATVAGALASVSIELLQVWFTRRPSGFDLLANTLGAAVGAVLARRCPARLSDLVFRFGQKVGLARVVLYIALFLGAVPLLVSIAQLVWDSRFTFQIRNEATYNRPWLGKICLVALYGRALSGDEISRGFHQGPSSLTGHSTSNLVALYVFNEGTGNIIRDVSGSEPARDLSFSPQGPVRWLDSGEGIEIVKASIVRSSDSPTKLFEALRATHELSIELWITPDNTKQRGQARIVSFSRNQT